MKSFALFASIVVVTSCGAAQVRVDLPKTSFASGELILASVLNQGRSPVSFCVEFGQRSYHNDEMEATPIPFLVQESVKRQFRYLFRKRWQALMIGPDIGSIHQAVTLDPGKRYEFLFRLHGKAPTLGLLLHYWQGEEGKTCSPQPNGGREIVSREFQILPEPEVR
jgi:hypothetical protein